MAAAVGSVSSASSGYTASLTINTPSSAAAGDLLIAAVGLGYGSYWVTSTGWSWLNSRQYYSIDLEILWRYHDGSSSSYVFSGWNAAPAAGGIVRVTGADPYRPLGPTSVVVPAMDSSPPYDVVYPALYAPLPNSLLLTFAAQQYAAGGTAPTFTAPSGMTEQWDLGSGDGGYSNAAVTAASVAVSAAGNIGSKTGQTGNSIFPGYGGETVGISALVHGPRTQAKKLAGVNLR